MKRVILFASILCVVLLICGSLSTEKENLEVKNGRYWMETSDGILVANINISDSQAVFSYDLISNSHFGTYVIEGNILTMTTYDGQETYVFKIKNDYLEFQAFKSSPLKYVDVKNSIRVVNGSKFKLKEIE